jgi:putative serine/threonine protein kinase
MLKELAKGKRSVVYLCKFNGKLAVKKIEKENIQAVNRINNEIFWLKKLNKFKIGPKLYSFKKNYFICEYIKGKNIIPYMESEKNPKKVILEVLRQCRILDNLRADKKEMTNPYKHIIIRKNKPTLIDFERTRFSEKPQNVTAFFQFLTSSRIDKILAKKYVN